jgi:acyl-CoA thioester hydrolase
MVHEKRIEIRWRDVDAYQHVNNAVYATYFEECRDEWLSLALDGEGDEWDFVLARVAIDFRRELRLEDEGVVVTCRIARVGTASVTLREEIHSRAGWLAAQSEAVVVARNRETGKARPLSTVERAAFERVSSSLPSSS